jgi:hypothetical protein
MVAMWLPDLIIHVPTLANASFAPTSEISTSAILNG